MRLFQNTGSTTCVVTSPQVSLGHSLGYSRKAEKLGWESGGTTSGDQSVQGLPCSQPHLVSRHLHSSSNISQECFWGRGRSKSDWAKLEGIKDWLGEKVRYIHTLIKPIFIIGVLNSNIILGFLQALPGHYSGSILIPPKRP